MASGLHASNETEMLRYDLDHQHFPKFHFNEVWSLLQACTQSLLLYICAGLKVPPSFLSLLPDKGQAYPQSAERFTLPKLTRNLARAGNPQSLQSHPISLNRRVPPIIFSNYHLKACSKTTQRNKSLISKSWLLCECQKAPPKDLSPQQRYWDDLNNIQVAMKWSREGDKGHDQDWRLRI